MKEVCSRCRRSRSHRRGGWILDSLSPPLIKNQVPHCKATKPTTIQISANSSPQTPSIQTMDTERGFLGCLGTRGINNHTNHIWLIFRNEAMVARLVLIKVDALVPDLSLCFDLCEVRERSDCYSLCRWTTKNR
jgi:hypothetical protein